MSEMQGLLTALKESSIQAFEETKPCGIFFGTVVSDKPLAIKIEQKITLTEKQLVLCREVTEYETKVTIGTSLVTDGTLKLGSLFMVGVKIANGINKKCPCPDVCALKEKGKKYDEYFSNDSRSIKEMDKRLAIVEIQVEGINEKLDRIDENVMELMKRGAFGGVV